MINIVNEENTNAKTQWINNKAYRIFSIFVKKKYLLKNVSLSIILVSKQKMKNLNYIFKKKNYCTDVLAFSSNEDNYIGEIVICYKFLEENFAISLHEDIVSIIIHGILHLIGYNHENEIEKKEMFSIQKKIYNYIIYD